MRLPEDRWTQQAQGLCWSCSKSHLSSTLLSPEPERGGSQQTGCVTQRVGSDLWRRERSAFFPRTHLHRKVLVTQSCPPLWNPMDCSLPCSSVPVIFQTRILEWVAIPFSKESSWPRYRIQGSWIAGRFFTIWATMEALLSFVTIASEQKSHSVLCADLQSLSSTDLH